MRRFLLTRRDLRGMRVTGLISSAQAQQVMQKTMKYRNGWNRMMNRKMMENEVKNEWRRKRKCETQYVCDSSVVLSLRSTVIPSQDLGLFDQLEFLISYIMISHCVRRHKCCMLRKCFKAVTIMPLKWQRHILILQNTEQLWNKIQSWVTTNIGFQFLNHYC